MCKLFYTIHKYLKPHSSRFAGFCLTVWRNLKLTVRKWQLTFCLECIQVLELWTAFVKLSRPFWPLFIFFFYACRKMPLLFVCQGCLKSKLLWLTSCLVEKGQKSLRKYWKIRCPEGILIPCSYLHGCSCYLSNYKFTKKQMKCIF